MKLQQYLFLCLLVVWCINCQKCYHVNPNDHYPAGTLPIHSMNDSPILKSRIKFSNNTAHYLFSPTDDKGTLCSTSWNKLWGTVRCGYLNTNHKDSDRFVWRRANSCLIFNGSHVVGEKPNCPDANFIEIAAYAYDNGMKPFEHIGTLLKQFNTKVQVETFYGYVLRISSNQTVYELWNDNFSNLLETQVITHRDCGSNYCKGMKQTLYFGGQCPAPQTVQVCYEELTQKKNKYM